MVAANDRTAIIFSLSSGEKHDAPEGRKSISQFKLNEPCSLLMDRAYEGDQTRLLSIQHGFIPVVPPKKNRLAPWEYDKKLYKRRNKVERLFRRLKGFHRLFTSYEKLDVILGR